MSLLSFSLFPDLPGLKGWPPHASIHLGQLSVPVTRDNLLNPSAERNLSSSGCFCHSSSNKINSQTPNPRCLEAPKGVVCVKTGWGDGAVCSQDRLPQRQPGRHTGLFPPQTDGAQVC